MASEVGICNESLQRLGAGRIVSLSDGTKNARECDVAYARERDALLRKHRWGFSISRSMLAAATVPPVFGPANYFPLPTDCLRILLPNDTTTDWVREENGIATDWAAPLAVRYVRKITDPNTMDPLFRKALAIMIAYAICEAITGSNKKQEILSVELRDIVSEAVRTSAIEQVAQDIREDDWVTGRL